MLTKNKTPNLNQPKTSETLDTRSDRFSLTSHNPQSFQETLYTRHGAWHSRSSQDCTYNHSHSTDEKMEACRAKDTSQGCTDGTWLSQAWNLVTLTFNTGEQVTMEVL